MVSEQQATYAPCARTGAQMGGGRGAGARRSPRRRRLALRRRGRRGLAGLPARAPGEAPAGPGCAAPQGDAGRHQEQERLRQSKRGTSASWDGGPNVSSRVALPCRLV